MEVYNVKMLHYYNGVVDTHIYSHAIESGVKVDEKKKKRKSNNVENDERKNEKKNTEKSLKNSLSRTKQKVYQYALANRWDLFVTMTFSPDMVDRYDYEECSKVLSIWLNNLRRKYPDLYYVFVPEQHKDWAWHFHGLLGGIDGLELTNSGHKTKKGDIIYNIPSYKKGFTTATYVQDMDAVSFYLTKYITKDLCMQTKGKKRYSVSRNLDLPMVEKYEFTVGEQLALMEELRQDCNYESVVGCDTVPQQVRYFQNNGLVLADTEIDELPFTDV